MFRLFFAGSSGLGKSTLVNTIFKSKVSRRFPEDDYHIPKTVEIKSISHGMLTFKFGSAVKLFLILEIGSLV